MKQRIITVLLTLLGLLILSGCGESYQEYSGLVQSVDLENQIVYVVSDGGEESLFQIPCAVDCRTAVQHDGIMLLDADSASLNLSSINMEEIREGDLVGVFLSEEQAAQAREGKAEAYQIQISHPEDQEY